MSKGKPRAARFEVEWITIKYRTLRRWLIAILLIGGGITAGTLWQRVRVAGERGEAIQLLALAERDLREARSNTTEESLRAAEEAVGQARQSLDAGDFVASRAASRRARDWIAEVTKVVVDTAQLLSVEGVVEVRRVGKLDWMRAEVGMPLAPGDLVKTQSGAAAQIANVDGSTATLRADTLLKIARSAKDRVSGTTDVAVEVSAGRLTVATSESQTPGSTAEVKTPNVSASFEANTVVGVGFEQAGQTSEIDVHEGSARVRSGDSEVVLGSSERVAVSPAGMTRRRLPAVPRLLSPPPQKLLLVHDLRGKPVEFEWESSRDARGYNVELAQTPLFTKSVRNWNNQPSTFVAADGLPLGRYYWRVTGVDRDGVESGPSPANSFRISDALPEGPRPTLEIKGVEGLGEGVFVFEGKTQPGVLLQIDDGNRVTFVQPQKSGEFRQIIQIPEDGVHVVTITARNSQGLESKDQRRVEVRLP